MTTNTNTAPDFTTVGSTQYILGTPDQVFPGATVTIGTRTYEVGELKLRGIIGGVEKVAARYTLISNSAPRSTVEWGDDPQDNTGYWMGR